MNMSDTAILTPDDGIAPKVTLYLAASKRVFGIIYSETMSATALDTSAYTQTGASGIAVTPNPQQVIVVNVGQPTLAHMLLFPYPTFTFGDSISVSIGASVEDLAGNSVDPIFSTLLDPSTGSDTTNTDFISPVLIGANVDLVEARAQPATAERRSASGRPTHTRPRHRCEASG